jgi:hypothetical protein
MTYEAHETGLSFWVKDAEQDESKMKFVNVAAAASITGFVRAHLLKSMKACSVVHYCDTDSIIGQGVESLDLGSNLGQWKLEAECDRVHIGGKKLYAAHVAGTGEEDSTHPETGKKIKPYKIASKGVRFSHRQIIAVSEGVSQTYQFDAPNYSPSSPPRFVKRTVNRDDKRIIGKISRLKKVS